MANDYVNIPAGVLRTFSSEVYEKLGLPREDAETVADTLVEADLRGVYSHGVMRTSAYMKRIQTGAAIARPNIRVVHESATTATIDGGDGMGQPVSKRAMELCIAKAKKGGIASVGVCHSNHFGAAAYWSMMALDHDLIGFSTTNASPSMAPTGGKQIAVGNNPFSWAIPAGEELPVVLDMAVSVVARGKMRMAEKKGEKIPLNWALDVEGEPTDDPTKAIKGMLLPVGGYKGYGLSVVMDVLSGVITGGNYGPLITPETDEPPPRNVGHFFMALDPAVFMPIDRFKVRVDELVRELKRSQLVKGCDRVLMPGEIEFNLRKERLEKGVPTPAAVIRELKGVAAQLGVKARLV